MTIDDVMHITPDYFFWKPRVFFYYMHSLSVGVSRYIWNTWQKWSKVCFHCLYIIRFLVGCMVLIFPFLVICYVDILSVRLFLSFFAMAFSVPPQIRSFVYPLAYFCLFYTLSSWSAKEIIGLFSFQYKCRNDI